MEDKSFYEREIKAPRSKSCEFIKPFFETRELDDNLKIVGLGNKKFKIECKLYESENGLIHIYGLTITDRNNNKFKAVAKIGGRELQENELSIYKKFTQYNTGVLLPLSVGFDKYFNTGCVRKEDEITSIILRQKTYDLRYRLTARERFSKDEAIKFSTSIVKTLEQFYYLGIMHSDIKPENIVYDVTDEPFIIDFGLSVDFPRDSHVRKGGTVEFASTDFHRGYATFRSDLISFGFVLYNIINNNNYLPWDLLCNDYEKHHEKILELKFKLIRTPKFVLLQKYFDIVFSRDMFEKPDYDGIVALFTTSKNFFEKFESTRL